MKDLVFNLLKSLDGKCAWNRQEPLVSDLDRLQKHIDHLEGKIAQLQHKIVNWSASHKYLERENAELRAQLEKTSFVDMSKIELDGGDDPTSDA